MSEQEIDLAEELRKALRLLEYFVLGDGHGCLPPQGCQCGEQLPCNHCRAVDLLREWSAL